MAGAAGRRPACDPGLHRLAEVYLGSRAGIEVTGRDELAARPARGEVLVLGVRPAAEYAARRTAGARSVPVAELRRHLNTLPAGAADPLRGEGFTIHPVTGLTASRLTELGGRRPATEPLRACYNTP